MNLAGFGGFKSMGQVARVYPLWHWTSWIVVKTCQKPFLPVERTLRYHAGEQQKALTTAQGSWFAVLVVGQRKCYPSFQSSFIVSPTEFILSLVPIVSAAKMNKGAFEYLIDICICCRKELAHLWLALLLFTLHAKPGLHFLDHVANQIIPQCKLHVCALSMSRISRAQIVSRCIKKSWPLTN